MSEPLAEKLKDLKAELIFLATNLLAASYRFNHESVVPSRELAQQMQQARASFEKFRTDVAAALDDSAGNLKAQVLQSESIDELDRIIKESLEKKQAEQQRRVFITVLDRVLILAHKDEAKFESLETAQGRARDLIGLLQHDDGPVPGAAQIEPFADLLKLVEEGATLDDAECDTLREHIAKNFDKALAMAASRGRLAIPKPNAPVAEAAPVEKPAPPVPPAQIAAVPKPTVATPKPTAPVEEVVEPTTTSAFPWMNNPPTS